MAITLEKRTKDCTASLDTYQQHLTAPLPHSVALHKCQLQWKEKEVCEKTVYTLGRLLCACLLAYMYSTCVNAATCVYTVYMYMYVCLGLPHCFYIIRVMIFFSMLHYNVHCILCVGNPWQ